jgi:hypothetical protein
LSLIRSLLAGTVRVGRRGFEWIGVLALPYIVTRNDHQDALGVGLAVSEFAPDAGFEKGSSPTPIRDGALTISVQQRHAFAHLRGPIASVDFPQPPF